MAALRSGVPASAAFLERLSGVSTRWGAPMLSRFAISLRFAMSLRFAVSLNWNDAAFTIGERVLARFAGRRLPPNFGFGVGAVIFTPQFFSGTLFFAWPPGVVH